MSYLERIQADLKDAMRGGEVLRRDTLRMLISGLKNRRIELGRDLDEADEVGVLVSAVKSRRDSAEQYERAGRQDLAEKEAAEIAIIEGYLPRQLGEAETRTLLEGLAREHGLSEKKDLGTLMKAVMARHKAEVDGKLVQRLANEILR